ncbi:protein SENSITIVE TO UV 2 [Nymphaea colorata]|nr:protein SENSITIVE TO UV 2 [Nymphaea colorata]
MKRVPAMRVSERLRPSMILSDYRSLPPALMAEEGGGEAEAMASGFGLEWDVDFEAAVCQDLDRIEEAMNAKREATQPQPSACLAAAPQARLEDYMFSFSPPRELSQSFPVDRRGEPSPARKRAGGDFHRGRRNSHVGGGLYGGKDEEIENLKKGLKSLHEKLIYQELECTQLLKDRDRKNEELKIALAQIADKDVEIQQLKQICKHQGTLAGNHHHVSLPSDHAVNSSERNGIVYPDFDTGGTTSSQWIRGKTSKRLFRDTSNLPTSLEKSSLRQFENSNRSQESALPNDLSMVSDLKARLSTDGASNSGTHHKSSMQVEANVCRETTAKPKFSKTVGIQTDAFSDPAINKEVTIEHHASNKLIKLWRPDIGKSSGQKLVRKLFASCAADLISLFKFMNMASASALDSAAEEKISYLIPHDCSYQAPSIQDTEAAKVGCFYLILTKVMNDMAQLDSLVEALLGLCCLRNVDIVHRSLRIIHSVLHHALILYSNSSRRSNIVVNHPGASNIGLDSGMPLLGQSAKWPKEISDFVRGAASSSHLPKEFLYTEKICEKGTRLVRQKPNINLVALFEKMHQIAVENTNHQIQLEAISVMNLIMMRSSPSSERNKFGTVTLLESISLLLQKRVALVVQLQAVRLLFLLLNCEEAMMLFCGGCKDETNSASPAGDTLDAPPLPACCSRILEGLAECVSCTGEGVQELVLRRHGIHVLAFVMASGEAAMKILNSGAFRRINLLELLVKVLTSELDAQEAESSASQDLCKERTSLIREALILLCRLVSHPIHSSVVLEAFASSRSMFRVLVDIAHRIIAGAGAENSQKREGSRRKDVNQADLIDLARVLKSRTSPLLGSIS